MSWISDLSKLYNLLEVSSNNSDIPLVPVSHSPQNAHVEIRLDESGNFLEASTLSKKDGITIVPVTEDSASRSSGVAPNFMHDKLSYIAADCASYTNEKKYEARFEAYIKQMQEWADSGMCPVEGMAVYSYIKKGTIIQDLISEHILFLNDKGLLDKKWEGDSKNKPMSPADTFVRFLVEDGSGRAISCNSNTKLFESFKEYYNLRKNDKRLCYVTGEVVPFTEKHSAKIRSNDDMAKLISANDSTGYTYRGIFHNSNEAVSVGYEASQKAHSALRWIMQSYGWTVGSETIAVWSMALVDTPLLKHDSYDIVTSAYDMYDEEIGSSEIIEEVVAEDVKKAIKGYRNKRFDFGSSLDDIVVMGIESAMPKKGRLAVTMYQKLSGSLYLERVENWHTKCAWHHSYKKVQVESDGNTAEKYVRFTGAPAPEDIVAAAYVENVSEKMKRKEIRRIIQFILTGNKGMFPSHLIKLIINRIGRIDKNNGNEINKCVSIGCALIRMNRIIKQKEDYGMNIDEENVIQQERDYIHGRIFAYMERIEKAAIYRQVGKEEDKRIPQVLNYWNMYILKPATTMSKQYSRLMPYIEKLYLSKDKKSYSDYLNTELCKLIEQVGDDDTPLGNGFLIGFAAQRNEFFKKDKKEEINNG